MIAVGLPALADDLGVERGTAAVLVTAYLVAMLVCQPVGGRLGDRFGNRSVLAIAIAGFGLASVAATAAPSFAALLVARCAQALFGAALIPNTQALLRATVPASRRGRTFGFVGTGIGAGAAIGPLLGGVLADTVGWRGIFAVNVPLGLLALAILARTEAGRLDDIESEPEARPTKGLALGLLSTGAFRAACLTQSTSTFALYTVLLVLPLLLADKGWAGVTVGLATSGLTAGLLVLGPLGGLIGDRRGRTLPIVAGMAIVVAGCGALAAAPRTAAALVAGPLVMGIGMGISGASLQAAALEAVPQAVTGSAAGLFSASRYVGSITGSLAISALGVTGAGTARPILIATVAATAVATVAGSRADPQRPKAEPTYAKL